MLAGLAFIHDNQVIHRDLKPANVLISVDGQAKLADFGTAFDLNDLTHTVVQTLCGTPAFMAPEVIRKSKHTTATDIWSMGVTIFNMITGELPFRAEDKYALLLKIATKTVVIEFPPNMPGSFGDIIESCLLFEPEQRPTAPQLLTHLSSLPEPNPISL